MSYGITTETIEASTNIFASEIRGQQIQVTIKQGSTADYKEGTLLGKIEATGKYTKWDNRAFGVAATDGSEILVGVLVHDVDATVEDTPAIIFINGDYNASALTAVTTVVAGVTNTLGTINIIEETA